MRVVVITAIVLALGATASADPAAEQLYDEGQQAFNRGDYPTAIARWRSSYEMSKLPLLVFNVAQAYRLAGDCAHALLGVPEVRCSRPNVRATQPLLTALSPSWNPNVVTHRLRMSSTCRTQSRTHHLRLHQHRSSLSQER